MGTALIGSSSGEFALHDSNVIASNYGYIPDASGSFEGRLRGDAGDRTFNVLGGVYYAEDISLAKSTGAVGTAELRIIYTVLIR